MAGIVLGGCAVAPSTPELERFQPLAGYRWESTPQRPGNDPGTLFILTFSGGGTRAAAFGYGVLEELRDTKIASPQGTRSLLDDVDLMTGTSGGSFTALAYALHGPRLFEIYDSAFLKRDVEGELLGRLFNPLTWPQVWTDGFGRSELAEEYYNEVLFHGATYADLRAKPSPLALVGATDVSTGQRIDFSQTQFDVICADLGRFPLARAAAASSAVPIIMSPVTLANRAGSCGYQPAPWMLAALEAPPSQWSGDRGVLRLRELQLLENSRERPYIHLVDGGLADNLALFSIVEMLQASLSYPQLRAAMQLDRVRRIAIVVINARSAPDFGFDRLPEAPGMVEQLMQSISVPMNNFSTEAIAALYDLIRQWQLRVALDAALDRLGQPVALPRLQPIEFSVIEVSFDAVTDPKQRAYLQNLPTSFALSSEAVDNLKSAAADVLRRSPEYRRFVRSLIAE